MTIFIKIVKASVITSVAIVSLAVAAPALAKTQQDDQLPESSFSTKGVDLASPAMVTKMQKKARRVAADMCFKDADGIRIVSASERECYTTALNGALAQIEAKHQLALGKLNNTLAADQSIRSSVKTDH